MMSTKSVDNIKKNNIIILGVMNSMESLTSAVNVQVDTYDKEVANNILKSLGLNMSTYVNMAIKQLIRTDGIPFEVTNSKPNNELLESIKEGNRSGYNNIDDLFDSLDN